MRTGQPLFNPAFDRRTGYRRHIMLCLLILNREGEPSKVVSLRNKRGGLFTAEDAARLQEFLRPLGTILDACRRPAHVGQAQAYA